MNDVVFWRIFWKEYRAQRLFWLVVAGAALCALAFFWMVIDRAEDRAEFLHVIAFLLPAVYALGCGAILFASEREEGTDELLRQFPLTSVRVLAGKFSFGIVSTLALLALLWPIAWLLTGRILVGDVETSWGIAGLEFLAWSVCFSLTARRTLTALALSLATVLTLRAFWPAGLIALPIVIVADVVLAWTWLDRDNAVALRWPNLSGLKIRGLPFDRGTTARFMNQTALRRSVRSLLWIEGRQAAIAAIFSFAVVIALTWGVAQTFPDPKLVSFAGFVLLQLVAFGLGMLAFHDQQRQFRFFSEHGVSPGLVWLVKLSVWSIAAVVVIAPFWCIANLESLRFAAHAPFSVARHWSTPLSNFASVTGFELYGSRYWQNEIPAATLLLLSCFGAGQMAAMLIPNAVTAGFLGSVLVGLLVMWHVLLSWLYVPLWWFATPIPALFLILTFRGTPRWINEREPLRLGVESVAILATAALVLYGALGIYRVTSVPQVNPIFVIPATASTKDISPEQIEAARLYREAAADLVETVPHAGLLAGAGIEDVPHEEFVARRKAWLDANRRPLELAVQAASLKVDPNVFDEDRIVELPPLVLASARALLSEGKLEESRQHFLAMLRMQMHASESNRSDAFRWTSATDVVLEDLAAWCAMPGQSASSIRSLINDVQLELARDRLGLNKIPREYAISLRELDNGRWPQYFGRRFPGELTVGEAVFETLFPWEFTRARRVLVQESNERYRMLSHTLEGIATPGYALATGFPTQQELHVRDWQVPEQPRLWAETTPLLASGLTLEYHHLQHLVDFAARRSMSLLNMALIGWALEHENQLPDTLHQLVDAGYFSLLPLDPWSGREFAYFPNGFHEPEYVLPHDREMRIPGGWRPPLLFSAGRGNSRMVQHGRNRGAHEQFVAVLPNGVRIYYSENTRTFVSRMEGEVARVHILTLPESIAESIRKMQVP